ncbi:MAG: permease-like cell division protein FtsX [Burkholderiaceae bacterium]
MSWLAPRRYAASRALRGMAAEPLSFLLALALAAVGLTIPLLLATLAHSIWPMVERLPTQTELTVFTLPGTGPAELNSLKAEIGRLPGVNKVRHLPRDAALADLNQRAGIHSGPTAANALPDLVVVSLAPKLDAGAVEHLATQLRKLARVDLVAFDTGWVRKLGALARAGGAILGALGSAVAILIVLVLAGSTRLAAAANADELRVLRLVGATPGFMARPYAWRGALTLGLAAAVAIGLVVLCVMAMGPYVTAAAALYGTELRLGLLPLPWLAGLVLSAGLLGWISAALAARLSLRRLT